MFYRVEGGRGRLDLPHFAQPAEALVIILRTRTEFAGEYLARTPLALALERTLECLLLSKQEFLAPTLDLGCGDGLFASILFADQVGTGIDLDPKEIAWAKRSNAYRELICCPGDKIPKADGTFRTTLSNSVLEHVSDLPSVLREVHRTLAPGGRFYFTVPTDKFERYAVVTRILDRLKLDRMAERYRTWYNRFWRHFHAYPPEKWEELAMEAGLEVIEMSRYNPVNATTRNDFLAPFGLFSSIQKRFTGRWVLLPGLRRMILASFARLIGQDLAQNGTGDNGSLLLVVARKPLK